ncbi:hypothetical protein L6452_08987 [Arctium lappa]|uniref:Uncharacterized protein n=1 Tax=Arctium lappa TaxID=4217 RepID=A0ACB9DJK4_ARCLA|nr:hypothetical protein L6452_08987 [Arctium lappa]
MDSAKLAYQAQFYKNDLMMSLGTKNRPPVLIDENEFTQWQIKSFSQIRRSNIFYDQFLDGSDTYPRKRSYKKEKLVWQKKPVKDDMSDELKRNTSCVHVHKAKKNNTHKGTASQGVVREQWLLNTAVQNPHLNVKIMASKYISLGPVLQRSLTSKHNSLGLGPQRSKRPYSYVSASDGYDGLHPKRNDLISILYCFTDRLF